MTNGTTRAAVASDSLQPHAQSLRKKAALAGGAAKWRKIFDMRK
jgi:hypothetical protein